MPNDQIKRNFDLFIEDAENFKDLDTNLTLSCLSHLKVKLQHITSKNLKSKNKVNIQNKDFLNKVMSLELKSIYPNNSDAYVEFKTNDKLSLYSTVTAIELINEDDGQKRIDLSNKTECCMSIFSHQT